MTIPLDFLAILNTIFRMEVLEFGNLRLKTAYDRSQYAPLRLAGWLHPASTEYMLLVEQTDSLLSGKSPFHGVILPTDWLITPNDWKPGAMDRKAFYAATKALQQLPQFDDAARGFAGNMLEAFSASPPLNRLLRSEEQLGFVACVLMLRHTRNPDDPSTGATYTRLVEIFAMLGVGSPTLIRAIVSLAQLRSQVRYIPNKDKRIKELEPTEKMMGILRVWFRSNLDAVQLIEPLPLPAADLVAMPGLLELTFTYSVQAYIHDGFILAEKLPPVRAFMQRNHGYLVLMKIIHTKHRATDGRLLASVPIESLARRIMLARGTVRNILKMALDKGWITHIGRGGHEVELSEEFARLCDDWMGLEFVWMAGRLRVAYATLTGIVK